MDWYDHTRARQRTACTTLHLPEGSSSSQSVVPCSRLTNAIAHPNFTLHYGDITDMGCLLGILQSAKFDEIYHLAGQSHVGLSFSMPVYTADATALGTVRLLQAVAQLNLCHRVRFYNVCRASRLMRMLVTSVQGMHLRTLRPDSQGRTRREHAVLSIVSVCLR